jgi:von Willebrand factor type A domain/Aerotolerance regulator N-terminal
MFFLNLTLPEFLALLSAASVVVVALYLLDRRKNKYVVPTLRFFAAAETAPVWTHRRKLQQPWSLVLQLVSLFLLLLAIAQLRLGSPALSSRDHVLIIDRSAWMAASSGSSRLIDQARAVARTYARRLPAGDRVMVLRADVLATPATLFESDRARIQQAIDQTQPSAASLNIQGALEFAQQAQKVRAEHPGEIVFVGAGRVATDQAAFQDTPPNFRWISIAGSGEHCGLRKVSVRRSANDPDAWDIFVAVKNYGTRPRSIPLGLQFGGSPVATRTFVLDPGAEQNASFQFRTRAAGMLEARLLTTDVFDQDHRALLQLPARRALPVTVYSTDPELLKPVFTSIPGVQATFLPPSKYDSSRRSGIVLLDHFAPAVPPAVPSIWIDPPADRSPLPVRSTEKNIKLKSWRADHPLGAGLRTKDMQFSSAEVFRSDPGDIVIAESDAGPLAVARPTEPKMVVLGFHPLRAGMKYELTAPLLFANMIHWIAPDVFRSWELTAGTVGTVDADLDTETDPSLIRVLKEDGTPLPFTVQGKTVRFFAADPGIVRLFTGDRELVYSLTLPQPGDVAWRPSHAKVGLPGNAPVGSSSRDVWQWLALLGAVGLLVDWILFGRMRGGAAPLAGRLGVPWRKAS